MNNEKNHSKIRKYDMKEHLSVHGKKRWYIGAFECKDNSHYHDFIILFGIVRWKVVYFKNALCILETITQTPSTVPDRIARYLFKKDEQKYAHE